MRNAGSTSVVSLSLVTALCLAACSDSGVKETPAPEAESEDRIEIALVASLSGADQGVGAEAQRGALVAIAQINALGGVLGKQLALRIVDDGGVPSATAGRVKELADEGVVFGIGPSTSETAKGILPLVKNDQVLYLTPSATSSELDCVTTFSEDPEQNTTQCADYKNSFKWDDKTKPPPPVLFKTAASDAMLATALAQFASETAQGTSLTRCNSIAIVQQADSYGKPVAEALRQRYIALSRAVLGPVDLDRTIDKTQVLKDAAAKVGGFNADCQAVIALPGVAAAYMRAWRDFRASAEGASLKPTFLTIGSDGFRQEQFLVEGRDQPNDPSSPTAGEGAFAIAADTSPQTPEFSQFQALFEAAYPNVSPGRYSSTAYDAVVMLASAFAKAKTTTDIPAVRKALFDISDGRTRHGPHKMVEFLSAVTAGDDVNYEGASGTIDFDEATGNVPNDFGVWVIENGTFQRRGNFPASVLQGGS